MGNFPSNPLSSTHFSLQFGGAGFWWTWGENSQALPKFPLFSPPKITPTNWGVKESWQIGSQNNTYGQTQWFWWQSKISYKRYHNKCLPHQGRFQISNSVCGRKIWSTKEDWKLGDEYFDAKKSAQRTQAEACLKKANKVARGLANLCHFVEV